MVPCGAREVGNRPELLDRTEPNAISLSEGAVDGSRFGNAQLSPMDHEGHVGRVGVTVTDETFRTWRLVDRCFEDPSTSNWITEVADLLDPNAVTATTCCQPQKAGVGDVPAPIEKEEIAESDCKSVVFSERPENL